MKFSVYMNTQMTTVAFDFSSTSNNGGPEKNETLVQSMRWCIHGYSHDQTNDHQ